LCLLSRDAGAAAEYQPCHHADCGDFAAGLQRKTALKGALSPWVVASALVTGSVLLFIFVRIQLRARVPMIDMRLFCHRIILSGVVMAMTAMIALVGFELLMAQELQFVHGFTPFEAGCSCCR
jgi:DHA2 family multidrug resistance protein-like MFS transporter